MTRAIHLPSPQATADLAGRLAPVLRAGDVLGLSGPLGAGKTAFARALIAARLAAAGRREEVPSPTYTLVQTYALPGVELWHADLYRLGDPGELGELGLTEAFSAAIVLVEWPERLGRRRPGRLLSLSFDFRPGEEEARLLRVAPEGPGWERVEAALAPAPAA